MLKLQTIPKDKAILFVLLVGFGILDYLWAGVLCTNVAHNLLFYAALMLQFYFSIEIHSMHTSELLTVDFRSHDKKLEDKSKELDLLIEMSKKNLLMNLAEGNISEKQAFTRFNAILRFNDEQPLALEAPKEDIKVEKSEERMYTAPDYEPEELLQVKDLVYLKN